jgi:hypothetical protein
LSTGYTVADLRDNPGNIIFLNDGNAEAHSPKNMFGIVDDIGGTSYKVRTIQPESSSDEALRIKADGDTYNRITITAAPKISLGNGSASPSAYLSYAGTDELETKYIRATAFYSRVSGDSYPRVKISGAQLNFGNGTYDPNASLGNTGTEANPAIGTGDSTILRIGSGAWNAGHIRMGNDHIWLDANKRLRIKSGSFPSSDTDGNVSGYDYSGSATWNPASLDDGAGETSSSVTVTGAALGDFCISSAPYDMQGIVATCYVDAADSAKIRIQNETGGTIDLASGTWRVRIIKQ